jgi:DnaJ-domain-containing protein 1
MGPVLVAGFFNARPTRLLRPYLASLSATSSATGSDLAQLGLSSGASASEIKRAYHTAVLTIHPDRNTSDVAKVL